MERTAQQTAAIETTARRVCVDAGAGSGKTRVLVERIAYLLETRRAKLDEIAAITFTEKAAGEMKERLRRTFRAKAPQTDAREMTFWRDLERHIESARISTIHAFCTALLKENALRLGLDPDFTILAETESVLLLKETITEALHRLFEDGDPAAMRLATEMRHSALVEILSGLLNKTMLMERIQEAYDFSDTDVLLQRWKEMTAAEATRRVMSLRYSPKLRRLLKALRRLDGCCTIDTDAREVRRLSMIRAIEDIFLCATPADVQRNLEILSRKQEGKAKKSNWDSEDSYDAVSKLQGAIQKFAEGYINNEPPSPEIESRAALLTSDVMAVYGRVREAYEAAKRRRNGLDYDDLIRLTLHALRDHPELRKRVAQGIRYLLIDEFQDTDAVQLEISRLLTEAPGGPDLFIVGDAKQSIYYFRGAEVEVFQGEREQAAEVLPLDRNFRTLPDILAFVNDFFLESGLLSAVEAYHAMSAERAPREEARIEFLVHAPPEGTEGRWPAEEYRRAEAKSIAGRIRAMCGGAEPVDVFDEATGAWRPAAYGDIALLFRAMSNIHLYEEALRTAEIPYVLVAGAGFYTRQEIVDLIFLLRAVIDPWDDVALFAFLRGPLAALSDEDLLRMARAGGVAAAFKAEAIPEGFGAPERLITARKLMAALRARAEMPAPALMRWLLAETGYEAMLLSQFLGVQKASNVRKLVTLSEDFARTETPSVRAFVRYLREVGEQAIREGEAGLQAEAAGAVTLITVHKSKGLEFPVVFVPDMSQGQQTSRNENIMLHRALGMAIRVTTMSGRTALPEMGEAIAARIAEEEEAEYARLLYVALTRARDYLVLSGSLKPTPDSWFDILHDAFGVCDLRHGARFSGAGWKALVQRDLPEPRPLGKAPKQLAPVQREEIERQILPCVSGQAQRTFPISRLLDHMAGGFEEEQEREEEELVFLYNGGLTAAARGTLVHRLFERWDFREAPPLDAIIEEARLPLRLRAAVYEDLHAITERFKASALGMRLAQESQLHREAPFYLRAGNGIITGKIDLLLPDGVIVDYKTGRADDAREARYEWQLLLYAAAVRSLLPIAPTQGILCYVDSGRQHEFELAPEEMDNALRHAEEIIVEMERGAPA